MSTDQMPAVGRFRETEKKFHAGIGDLCIVGSQEPECLRQEGITCEDCGCLIELHVSRRLSSPERTVVHTRKVVVYKGVGVQALDGHATHWAPVDGMFVDISADASPWRHSAREVMALVAIKQGDTAQAKTLLKALSENHTAPAGVRKRAVILLARLNG